MAEYIDLDTPLEMYRPCGKRYEHISTTLRELLDFNKIPHTAADVAPVKHGRWKPYDLTYGRSVYYCTACEHSAVVPTVLDEPIFNYCPNCGAKMQGG